MQGDDIRIIPSQENEIFVPSYDPNEVYDLPEGSGGPYLTFGVGYPVGPWLGFECDWDDFGIWAGPWHSGWGYRRDWNNGGHGWSRWHPNPGRAHALVRGYYHPGGNLPSPRGGAFASRPPARGPAPRSPAPGLEGRNDYRGYGGAAPRTPAPSSPVFGSYGRGTQTRDFSNRGKTSRQAPVRAASPGRSAPASREESRPRH